MKNKCSYLALNVSFIKKEIFKPNLRTTEGIFLLNWEPVPQ